MANLRKRWLIHQPPPPPTTIFTFYPPGRSAAPNVATHSITADAIDVPYTTDPVLPTTVNDGANLVITIFLNGEVTPTVNVDGVGQSIDWGGESGVLTLTNVTTDHVLTISLP